MFVCGFTEPNGARATPKMTSVIAGTPNLEKE